jgi:hypothetical protein
VTRRSGGSGDTHDLLDFGQLIIAGMKLTTGDGSPDAGAQFLAGHEGFNRVGQALGSAAPDDRWDGTGARAYADQNTRQRVRTETMADADRAVFTVLARESLQIQARRDVLDTQSELLAKTSHATDPLQFIPRYGEAAKLAIESAALQGALQLSAIALHDLHSEVSANAAELGQAIGRYAGVADGADTPTSALDFDPEPRARVDADADRGDTVAAELASVAVESETSGTSPVAHEGPSSDGTELGEGVHVGG